METLKIAAVEKAWVKMTEAIGLAEINNEAEYEAALAAMEQMIERVRDKDRHPLHGPIAWIARLIEEYETHAHPVPVLSSVKFLTSLMREHGLRQSDLPEVGTQSVISEILRGKRQLNARQIAALSKRFKVSADVFLG